MKHERIISPRLHPIGCACSSCSPGMPFVDRLIAWLLATAVLLAFASLLHT